MFAYSPQANGAGWDRGGVPGLRPAQGDERAPIDQTATRDPRLPERVHPAARIRAESRGDRTEVQPVVTRDGAQAPHEPPGKRIHPPRLEPQSIGGASA